MKKIETEADKERKKKRNNLIVGLIMIFLIGLSSLGYAIMSKTDSASVKPIKYGNLEFTKSNDLWSATINSKVYYFYDLPTSIENVSTAEAIKLDDFYGKTVYFVNINSAIKTLSYALDGIASRTQEACLEKTNCTNPALPIKNCNDSVIVFDASKIDTKIYKINNCVFLEGNSFKAVDKLMYGFFNIA
jgi:hypothetical protein